MLLVAGSLSYVHHQALTNWIGEDYRNQAILFSLEISATINDLNEFSSVQALERDMREIMAVRRNVVHMEVLGFSDDALEVVASSATRHRVPVTQRDVKKLRDGKVISRLGRLDGNTTWNTIVPISVERRLVGALATRFSVDEVDDLTRRISRWTIALTVGAGTAMVALMALVVTLLVNRPVHKLLGAVNRYRAGGAGVTVTLHGKDEFADLAAHFNEMMRRIDAFGQEMAGRVSEATRQLEDRYQEVCRLNETLHRMRAELSRAERMAVAGHVVAEVAHEVGTPLHSISGHLELLRSEIPNAGAVSPTGRRLDIIQGQVRRVEAIIRQLLDLSRRDLGPVGAVDLAGLIHDAAEVVSPGVPPGTIDLSAVPRNGLPPVTGRKDQLMQVMLNLLANAMDAVSSGGAISIAAREAGAGMVEIAVRDTGPGIPRERQAHIFKPYVTSRPPGKGTGLGLFVASEIVRGHGGRIAVESAPGEGCTMRVLLPASGGA